MLPSVEFAEHGLIGGRKISGLICEAKVEVNQQLCVGPPNVVAAPLPIAKIDNQQNQADPNYPADQHRDCKPANPDAFQ